MIRALGICGSPIRGGNTEILINEALRTNAAQCIKTELLAIAGERLQPSTGSDEGDRLIEDDAGVFLDKMLQASAIIIGSPVYFRNVTGQLKILMDRTRYLHAGYQLRGRIGGAIAVTGTTGAEDTLSAINTFFLQHRMIVGHPGAFAILGEARDVRKNEAALKGAQELGRTVASLIRRINARGCQCNHRT